VPSGSISTGWDLGPVRLTSARSTLSFNIDSGELGPYQRHPGSGFKMAEGKSRQQSQGNEGILTQSGVRRTWRP
jgi:hypothetical protein